MDRGVWVHNYLINADPDNHNTKHQACIHQKNKLYIFIKK